MTIFGRSLSRFFIRGSIIQRDVGDMMAPLQFFKHVVGSDFSALINRMK